MAVMGTNITRRSINQVAFSTNLIVAVDNGWEINNGAP